MSFFSPFANIMTIETRNLVPFTLSISCLNRSNKKTLQITIKDGDVLSKLNFTNGGRARVQAATRDEQPYMTIQLIDEGMGEGKLTKYKTHFVIKADDLPFFPKEAHKIKTMSAFYDQKDRSIILRLPDDYTPLHDSMTPFEYTDPQPEVKNWPLLGKIRL